MSMDACYILLRRPWVYENDVTCYGIFIMMMFKQGRHVILSKPISRQCAIKEQAKPRENTQKEHLSKIKKRKMKIGGSDDTCKSGTSPCLLLTKADFQHSIEEAGDPGHCYLALIKPD